MKKKKNKAFYCSFCGKSQHEVKKLIAGPTVFVCNECVELCADIIDYTPWKYYLSKIKYKLKWMDRLTDYIKKNLNENKKFI